MLDRIINQFLIKHKLSPEYKGNVFNWFLPIAEKIVAEYKILRKPIIVGINGAQGSGKSTLSDLLGTLFVEQYGLNSVTLSIDDFYFTCQERQALADSVHPLLATRGVPGTHDVSLAMDTINNLLAGRTTYIPRFDKASDDRYQKESWSLNTGTVDIIILEGWCLGAEPQSSKDLEEPINGLETRQDSDGTWRQYVNQQLQDNYPQLFSLIDLWIMLKAPSFDVVYNWRLEQEHKLRASQLASKKIMSEDGVSKFIMFYQRITEHVLQTLPGKMDFIFELDSVRKITKLTQRQDRSNMQPDTDVLIFTDMDGSLLCHETYSHEAADEMLNHLQDIGIPVIPTSSKTELELLYLRHSLNNNHPFIIENGAAIFIPIDYFLEQPFDTEVIDEFWVKKFVHNRHYWQSLITHVSSVDASKFTTFSKLTARDISVLTGLDDEESIRASCRLFGEPVVWNGSDDEKEAFIKELQGMGAKVLQGGRFLHVSGECDKGQAMNWLAEQFRDNKNGSLVKTVAIGDSQNDVAMLEQANIALIIRSPAHKPPELKRNNNTYISEQFGPDGWAQGVSNILEQHAASSN